MDTMSMSPPLLGGRRISSSGRTKCLYSGSLLATTCLERANSRSMRSTCDETRAMTLRVLVSPWAVVAAALVGLGGDEMRASLPADLWALSGGRMSGEARGGMREGLNLAGGFPAEALAEAG